MNQRVFLTYHLADRDFSLQLARTLKTHGVNVSVDEWSFAPGADRDESFLIAMQGCSHLLVVLSPDASTSREIDSHIYHVLQNNKIVLPIIHRRCDIPLRIRGKENIDCLTLVYNDAIAKLLRLFGKTYREPGKGRKALFKSCTWVTVGIDDTIEHEAWNDSDQPRIVLILDVWNPHLTAAEHELLADFHAIIDPQ